MSARRYNVISDMAVSAIVAREHSGLFEERQYRHGAFLTGIDIASDV